MKASEFETFDKTVEAARHVELSFQAPSITSNANKSLNEWKVTPNALVSSTTTVKPQLENQHPQRQQRACDTYRVTVLNIAKRISSNPRSAGINGFLSPTVKKMATNASTSGNTSANSAINGGCKDIKHPENRPLSTACSTTSDEVDFLRQSS